MPPKRKGSIEKTMSARGPRPKTLKRATPNHHRRSGISTSRRRKLSATVPVSNPRSIFRFLDLPREIRDQVYDEIWKTKEPFITRFGRFLFYVEYKVTRIMSSISLGGPGGLSRCLWLATNKQLRSEAIEQFQRIAKWVYRSQMPVDWTQRVAPRARSLISPWKAHTLEISHNYVHFLYTMKHLSIGTQTHLEAVPVDYKGLTAMMSKPTLRQLNLSFYLMYCSTFIDDPTPVANLRACQLFTNLSLRKVELTLILHCSAETARSSPPTFTGIAEVTLQEELIRFGKVLVGEEANVRSTIMSDSPPTMKFEFERA